MRTDVNEKKKVHVLYKNMLFYVAYDGKIIELITLKGRLQ